MSNTEFEYLFTITKGTGSTGENGKELQTELKSYANKENNELIELPFVACRAGTGNDYPTIRYEFENISTGVKTVNRVYTQNDSYKYFKVAIFTTGKQIKARFFLYDKDYNEISLSSSYREKSLVSSANFQTYRFRVISYHSDYSATDNYAMILPPEPEAVFYKMPTKRQTIKFVKYKAKTRCVKRIYKTYTIPTKRQIKKNIQVSTSCNTRRQIVKIAGGSADTKRISVVSSISQAKTIRQIKMAIMNVKYSAKAYRKAICNTSSAVNTILKTIKTATSSIPAIREIVKDNFLVEYSVKTKRIVIKIFPTKSIVKCVRVVKEYEKRGTIELLQSNIVKNEKGQSNIKYEQIDIIKGKYYPIKANIESTPIGLSDKTKFLLITKNRKIKSEHFVRVNGRIYGIDMLTKYSVHKEVYLKEL